MERQNKDNTSLKPQCRRIWFLIMLTQLSLICYYYPNLQVLFTKRKSILLPDTEPDAGHHFLIHTPACSIPKFDPDHPSIVKYKHPPKKIICKKERPLTSISGLTLHLHPEYLIDYGQAKGAENLTCSYQGIQRIQERPKKYGHSADKKQRLLKKVLLVSNLTKINEDGVLVTCTIQINNVSAIYKNVHTFIQPRRAKGKKEKFQKSGGWSKHSDMLNLVIIGTDATSRLNLLRHMPKTYKFLTQDLDALDFRGFNKVGDNTDPNLRAALMGWSEKEFKEQKICAPYKWSKYDDCPIIWKEYSSKGYVTAYAEDSPWMGVFHYNKLGFVKEPTDYYNRPYYLLSEKQIASQSGKCQGNKLSIEVIRDWNLDLLSAHKDVPVFSFTWTASITHDYLAMASVTDEPHLLHLQSLRDAGYLNNTIVAFMSDHGQRHGDIRSTYVGMLEERLPFLFLVFPPWFKEKYPKPWSNMVTNTRRLVTFFDIHSTLKAIVDSDYSKVNLSEYKIGAGQSLFVSVPLNRTCESAGIPHHYCACEETEEVDPKNTEVHQTAIFAVETLNSGLKNFSLCAQLELKEVKAARMGKPSKNTTPKSGKGVVQSYQITFETIPGEALYEATIRKDNKQFKMSAEASRINKYGDQSHCIEDFTYRKYCYCIDLLTPEEKKKQLFYRSSKEKEMLVSNKTVL